MIRKKMTITRIAVIYHPAHLCALVRLFSFCQYNLTLYNLHSWKDCREGCFTRHASILYSYFMPVCVIVKTAALGTVDSSMYYCPRYRGQYF